MNKKDVITKSTIALLPAFHKTYRTELVLESGERIMSTKSVRQLLDEACLVRGSSYDGRIKSVRNQLNYNRKTPLMICQHDHIFAFPTVSPSHYTCIWLFTHHIHTFTHEKGKTAVIFKNGLELEVPCSVAILIRQREKTLAAMYHFMLPKR
ncbi:competence protein ComK [Bacillus sp. P14.5]|uniref:competence protein ComK n=1 Tax=Bacillus sp. P14.5 TaxID=1983400 RepID=UPI0013B065F1|nr:competence protein ComK [Bacillus sp. P14.5]